ncbi:hypothetical protein JJJ17_09750 [Paracoccus caeni]|uniref:Uncharacterized protein n=1 Tax=Paracoccus caeni TaxID=657651 RepID=A0A934SE37_9RHOB|nr:hypothetical protein [Paracoccus caeni]MBK4216207.1 hypothetical protein [Paracoccus caeni]
MQFFDHGVHDGIWSGLLEADRAPARLYVTLRGEIVAKAILSDGPKKESWQVQVALPGQVISDGVHSLVLVADDADTDAPVQADALHLGRLALLAGTPLNRDVEAEIALLRDELELLKREFRHFAAGD